MSEPPPHPVVIAPYDPHWPRMAARESGRLATAVGPTLLRWEHFGSTAVPGLAAKPVIDLMGIVAHLKDLDGRRPHIEAAGYQWYGEFGIPGRRFNTLTRRGRRVVHLHFYQRDSEQVGRHLSVRDYLRSHPSAARDYEAEKRRAAAIHPDDSLAYNREKDAWVQHLERMAMTWATTGGAAHG
ncbi:MAG: GrpB family protein [Alphaproteobacteria bacterium]|nr:GrpB family protein [Alphaproteobacteria bacterium]